MLRMHEFNQSLKYDKRMYAADVKGSIAFSKALLKAGIVSDKEQKEIERGLKEVEGEWARGEVSALSRSSHRRIEVRLHRGAYARSSRSSPTTRTFTRPTSAD